MSKKEWFCSRKSINEWEPGSLRDICDECEAIENDGYKVEQIVYVNGQYQIFYSKRS